MNPSPANKRGLIKIHKAEAPIRPIINWQQAPAYNLAKLFSERLMHDLQLPFTFNIKNSIQLMSELREINPYTQKLHMASFDISNMYTTIPTSELPKIIDTICNRHNIPPQQKLEIFYLVKLILKQNYFTFKNHTYTQQEGLAMRSPTSVAFSEVFLQYIEHYFIYDFLK
jgi:hypothetical protein